ncbi:MAG: DUF3301 domain-containing protein [Burkholderiales bacterium]
MWELAAIAVVLAAVWFWVDSLRARERALKAGRGACRRYGVQLLDDTVAIARLRLARDRDGRLRLERHYVFEFSETGDNRRQGSMVLLGAELSDIQLEPYTIR